MKLTSYPSLLLAALLPLFASAQNNLKVTSPGEVQLPKGIKYNGKFKHAIRWTDAMGDNMVVIAESGIFESVDKKDDFEGRNADLYAYHYLLKDTIQQVWKIYDFVHDCGVDVIAGFIENTLQVTDLNNDGVAEIWVMYKKSCRGDVSPDEMKIIMYQGRQKFAMRGTDKVKVSRTDYAGGEYTFDSAFTDGPAAFREFAIKLWEKNVRQ